MIEILLRGIPYYFVFILLFIIYQKYNVILSRLKKYKSYSKGDIVVRNKVKRRLRSAFCELYPNVKKNYNYIFSAKQGIEELSFVEIKDNMKQLFVKNGLYEENN